MPTITECQLGCQAGIHSEGLPFRHSTPLCFPLLTPVPCCGCCLPWSPSSQPLMPRASCLCSKPSIPAQEQSQGAEPAKGTQLQPRLPSSPSLIQALLCIRKSHSYFLGRAPMTNPTCSKVLALEPSGEQPPPKGLLFQHSRNCVTAAPGTTKVSQQCPQRMDCQMQSLKMQRNGSWL